MIFAFLRTMCIELFCTIFCYFHLVVFCHHFGNYLHFVKLFWLFLPAFCGTMWNQKQKSSKIFSALYLKTMDQIKPNLSAKNTHNGVFVFRYGYLWHQTKKSKYQKKYTQIVHATHSQIWIPMKVMWTPGCKTKKKTCHVFHPTTWHDLPLFLQETTN